MLKQEHGTVMLISLFFLICLFAFSSLVLLLGQGALVGMRTQQTADLITKGARAAGKWTKTNPETGETKSRLFATTQEAREQNASIIRGAREEAEKLFELNRDALEKTAHRVDITHQKGEKHFLYNQGIYHLEITVEQEALLLWETPIMKVRRVSQSELNR
ncbi:hypothetical protein EDM56_23165 [Brevibacillus fluminis]|uniref:Uncharacterized protein n=1 Tax=Brevibacillus fluminis TaxID=511487 RepID=A0A3M8D5E0_9BACL|nr:hypothetical protein [Brevibacillus fluminis]RNB82801.1 hypothetical protein EDM56_23165 [Brevibacillus fluminis]